MTNLQQIADYPNYFITQDGRVWSSNTKSYLKSKIDKYGYVQFTICKSGKHRTFTAHRLVAAAYIPNPENKPQVNHIDCNTQNNNVLNLEWCTQSENRQHAFNFGSAVISEKCRIAVRNKLNKKILDKSTGVYYESVKEAASKLNINYNTLRVKLSKRGGNNTPLMYA